MASIERVIILVLDSVGAGELPDAAQYGDQGSNTLANTAEAVGGLDMPNFGTLGLGNIIRITGVPPAAHPLGCYGKMASVSVGKDTTIGHWELAGVVTARPFPIYPNGFPPEVIEAFEVEIGRKILGNYPASGTEIIEVLGKEHMETGFPIVYTSGDSVFQIACHEDIVPIEQLYDWCRIARQMLVEPHNVLRVIARPFVGVPGSFRRTERRKDFNLQAPGKTVLDAVFDYGGDVIAVGKIHDIFSDRGISKVITTSSNSEGMIKTTEVLRSGEGRLVFTNLVDFDMLYGHRNDARGYAQALKQVDDMLPDLLGAMKRSDLLIVTADHGCDPTTPSTDHSREHVPLLVYGPSSASDVNLGVRKSFCDVAATSSELLGVSNFECGDSFASEIMQIS